jgi:uncharacterized membrane protein YozB (DUF420 family)
MDDLFHSPGFLGTNANLAADVTLVLSIAVAILFSVGFFIARQGSYTIHGRIQTVAATINLIFVLWMMILPFRDFVLGDKGGPRPGYFYVVTGIHALTGVIALIFGWFVVLRGHNLLPEALKFDNYKPYMRVAYSLYILATLIGLGVYLAWFVLVPNPPIFE